MFAKLFGHADDDVSIFVDSAVDASYFEGPAIGHLVEIAVSH